MLFLSALVVNVNAQDKRLRLGIYGLNHDHILGFFNQMKKGTANVVGVYEPSKPLWDKYKKRYNLPDSLYFDDVHKMIKAAKPDVMLGYNAVGNHVDIVEICAPLHIPVMVEKPLAATLQQAKRIEALANKYNVKVLVNYETTWYASNAEALREAQDGKLGKVWKVVVHDGHEGPEEIGVQPEFLKWLTDPQKNGAGAMYDFGCYGADLMTVLMHGETPVSVTAVAQTDKPDKYPHVDDDATIIVRYAHAQAVLQPSWNWPFARKDMEVYGATGYAITVAQDHMRVRYAGEKEEQATTAPALPAPDDDSLHYLEAAISGKVDAAHSLGGIETNIVVMQILDAARESSKTGRTVMIHAAPTD